MSIFVIVLINKGENTFLTDVLLHHVVFIYIRKLLDDLFFWRCEAVKAVFCAVCVPDLFWAPLTFECNYSWREDCVAHKRVLVLIEIK